MKLDAIGRVDKPEEIDVEPITIPVIGYTRAHKEVCEEFNFRPTRPWGNLFAMFEADDERGFAGGTVRWLHNCLLDDAERERWKTFLLRDDVEIEQATIEGVFSSLSETYSARPILPRSASTGGGAQTKRTSQAASRSRASASKNSHSPSP
jgi:hypothetical protein